MMFDPRSALQRVHLRDLLVNDDTAPFAIANLQTFATTKSEDIESLTMQAETELCSVYGFEPDRREDRKVFVYQDGVAVIPVHGTLLNRCNWSWGFITGYQFLYRQIEAVEQDDDVDLVVFDYDSPGGEAAGCFELGERMAAMEKPTIAVIDSVAASGGYALAAAQGRVTAIPSARVGSIGVYRMHVDVSESMKKDGVKVTFIKAGENKVDGNAYEALPDSVRANWQAEVNKTWDDFVNYCADMREMPAEAIRATQAKVYRADEALALGLIDGVSTPTEAVAAFFAGLPGDPTENGDEEMATPKTNTPKEATSDEAVTTQAAPQAAGQITAADVAAAVAAGIAGEKTRTNAILGCDAAKTRPALAQHLAAATSMTPEEAQGVLSASAEETPAEKPKKKKSGEDDGDGGEGEGEDDGEEGENASAVDQTNHLDAQMARSKQPNVGAGSGKGGSAGTGEKTDADLTAAILGDYSGVTGFKAPAAK